MKKFGGKCFSYKARNLTGLKVDISLGGEDAFSVERNKISPRVDEPHYSMPEHQLDLTYSYRTGDELNLWGRNLTTGRYTVAAAKEDTTKGRRNNDRIYQIV